MTVDELDKRMARIAVLTKMSGTKFADKLIFTDTKLVDNLYNNRELAESFNPIAYKHNITLLANTGSASEGIFYDDLVSYQAVEALMHGRSDAEVLSLVTDKKIEPNSPTARIVSNTGTELDDLFLKFYLAISNKIRLRQYNYNILTKYQFHSALLGTVTLFKNKSVDSYDIKSFNLSETNLRNDTWFVSDSIICEDKNYNEIALDITAHSVLEDGTPVILMGSPLIEACTALERVVLRFHSPNGKPVYTCSNHSFNLYWFMTMLDSDYNYYDCIHRKVIPEELLRSYRPSISPVYRCTALKELVIEGLDERTKVKVSEDMRFQDIEIIRR